MSFKEENIVFLEYFIINDLCMQVNKNIINRVSIHPIVLYHSKNHTLNLKVFTLHNQYVSDDLLDAVGLALTRMCWPKKDDSPEFHLLFKNLINSAMPQHFVV
jgi:hypothetical protein